MTRLFSHYIEDDGFYLKYAKGRPAATGQEFHDYHEFVLFLGGDSHLISKNIQTTLSPQSLILIPKEQYHRFCVAQPSEYLRCILAFRDTLVPSCVSLDFMNRVQVIPHPDKRVLSLFSQLTEIAESPISVQEKKLFIHASVTQLLILFSSVLHETAEKGKPLSPLVSQALDIIDARFSENLSLESLAEDLHVSPSTLSHKFRTELHISPYRYLTKKRLSEAHRAISMGEPRANAATSCGFSDYSCFYRLYKKYYHK